MNRKVLKLSTWKVVKPGPSNSRWGNLLVLLLCLCNSGTLGQRVATKKSAGFDLIVYGATPSGISAAINAARSGLTVGLFEASAHWGGLTAGGLSYTDFRTMESVQGTFREFMNRVLAYYTQTYGPDSQQVRDCYFGAYYEPKVARQILRAMLDEQPLIKLHLNHPLQEALLGAGKGNRKKLRGIRFREATTGKVVEALGQVFIDATYEGDLMAAAGCRFRVGRESRREYGERFAGKLFMANKQFLPGSTGEGDRHVQCYNFRICLSHDSTNRLPIPQPADYRRDRYSPLLKAIKEGAVTHVAGGWDMAPKKGIASFRSIPNGKADMNDLSSSPLSLRLTGVNDAWPEGDAQTRQHIVDLYKNHSLGLLYFLQNDEAVPDALRKEARQWGLPKDEYPDTDHFTPALYVREGRRLVGSYVFTEQDLEQEPNSVRSKLKRDAVAVGDYSMDCHGEQAPNAYHAHVTEGAFALGVLPFQLPYGIMVPWEVDGLLVSVAVSASHAGFSALRMEPTWTSLGQAAGLAAAQAVRTGGEVRDINVARLREGLHERGAIPIYLSDVMPDSPYFKAAQYVGTRGLLHAIPGYDTTAYEDHMKVIRGQFTRAFPHHGLEPTKPMTTKLADLWLKKVGLTSAALSTKSATQTRGQFLNEVYRLSK